ncbi:MAG: glycosyltransferase, partial [Desulfobulbaceae bacterium]|nr:glycosyltransferase [Desulfobulbaceae bacterium]
FLLAGGIENFLGDLLAAQGRQGVSAAALVHEDPALPVPENDNPPDNVFRTPCYGRLLYAPISPGFPWTLRRMIKKHKPDLLHIHMPNTSALAALLVPSARKIPWVVHWHADVVSSEVDTRMGLAYRFYRPLEQWLLARASAVVATSERYLQSSGPLRRWRAKCTAIPLGMDVARLPEPDLLPIKSGEEVWGAGKRCRVLAVGRLTYYKGHEVLIRAATETPDLRVVIVGEGEQRAGLERLVEQLGVQDQVTLVGFQPADNLHALIATCDCLCLPSIERTEAFGLVLLEAMRYGKPVVASDVGGSGIGWVVQDGKTGLLVSPGEVSPLAAALRKLAEDQSLRQQLGDGGRERFSKMYHIDPVAVQIKSLYEQIIEEREI